MKNKSKILLISTIMSTIIGVAAKANAISLWWTVVFASSSGSALAEIFRFFLILATIYIWPIVLLVLGIFVFQIITAWISFLNNKKSWTIIHVIMLIVVSFIGLFIEAIVERPLFSLWLFLPTVILRIFGYFKQKKINMNL